MVPIVEIRHDHATMHVTIIKVLVCHQQLTTVEASLHGLFRRDACQEPPGVCLRS